jgi:hypothetical protein
MKTLMPRVLDKREFCGFHYRECTTIKTLTSDAKKDHFSKYTAINDVGYYENALSLIERHKL